MSTALKEALIGCILRLKEGAGQHRQAELNVEDDEKHTEKAAQDSQFQKPTRIDDDWRRKEEWGRDSDKFFAECDVFKDRLLGKPSESFEQYTSDKQGLVAVDDPAADAAEIIEKRDQLEPPTIAENWCMNQTVWMV